MIKKLLALLLVVGYLNASLINGIAVIVNTDVITLYDIDEVMTSQKISNNKAVNILIEKLIYEQEVKKLNLTIEQTDINDYLEKLADLNKLSVEEFKKLVKEKENYTQFISKIKKQLLSQKVIAKIAYGKIKIATDEDMKLYYDNNIEEFKASKDSIQVVPFENVKNKIFTSMMTKREQKFLKEYFEALKITADIKIVR